LGFVWRLHNIFANDEWWHRLDQAPIQLETLSPVATHGLFSVLFGRGGTMQTAGFDRESILFWY
jgi:hypothetical protein